MEQNKITRGGVYLAKLNPTKKAEVGKVRPVIVLNAQVILDVMPHVVFVCPLSSKSFPQFSDLHIELNARDNLMVRSYALIEHCRSISVERLTFPRLAQLTAQELKFVLQRLQRLIGL